MYTRPVIIEEFLNNTLNPAGYHAWYTDKLPQKLMAVRSGLGVYGRNNICYVQGMGSFNKLTTFFSDMPCDDKSWHDLRQTAFCRSCKICLKKCPTQAITDESRLIHWDRCLTHFNEHSGTDFPQWIAPSAHNSIVGCMACQYSCPSNREFILNADGPVVFSEGETRLLLAGNPSDTFSDALRGKLQDSGLMPYLGVLPRNLKFLFDKY
ncbi:MAG: hypothetical protein N2376_13015 [Clostridia bacterium]|nr:hypothetical protein [Clostridia bacterium]